MSTSADARGAAPPITNRLRAAGAGLWENQPRDGGCQHPAKWHANDGESYRDRPLPARRIFREVRAAAFGMAAKSKAGEETPHSEREDALAEYGN